jgi:hypothetical protein
MKSAIALLAVMSIPARAHVMSMSSGDLMLDGARAHYELRMPLYEITHVRNPEQTLLEHIRFAGARMTKHECHNDTAHDAYLCGADYEWPAPVDRIDAECTFPSITVPNHVHLLRAKMGAKHDQAVFDLTSTRATLRFRPLTKTEIAITQSGAGFVRALGGPIQLLFLAALALAARSRRELLALAAMFLAGQIASVAIVPRMGWQPATRFVEAATALTIAYLAVEILLLPKAGSRWAIAGILGVFHGLYFCLFVQTTQYSAVLVLAGAAVAELLVLALWGLLRGACLRPAMPRCVGAFRTPRVRVERILAIALLAFGTGWFLLRLWM